MKNAVNVPSKSNEQKNVEIFVVVDVLKVTDEITGSGSASGSESGSTRYGSPGTDPYQNVMDPQHWYRTYIAQ